MRPKRLISLLVAVCMMITMLPLSAVTAFAADTEWRDANEGGYKYWYTLNSNNTATITSFAGPVDPTETHAPYDIEIPATLDGYTVTGLGEDSFYERTSLESVTLGPNIKTIGEKAFYNCPILKTLTINSAVTSMGKDAFADCPFLTSVTLGQNIKTIGEEAFYNCPVLDNVIIPQNVTSIGPRAFNKCTGLITLTINSPVMSMGEYAFADCDHLTSLSLCNDLQTIGDHAFEKCTSLKTVNLPKNLTSIGSHAFDSCTSLDPIEIPGTVTEIGDYAFYNCDGLNSATIEEGVQSTGVHMFYGCDNLATVKLPESLTTIGAHSFGNCYVLNHVKIPDKVTSIGEGAFVFCGTLSDLTLGSGLTEIGKEAFSECSALTTLTLPSSLKKIDEGAFCECNGFHTFTLPEGVETIGKRAFERCQNLTSITLPDSVTEIGQEAFEHCKALESITIPKKVKTIEPDTFYYCFHLKYITLPAGLTSFKESLQTCIAGQIDEDFKRDENGQPILDKDGNPIPIYTPNGAIYYNSNKTDADKLLANSTNTYLKYRNFLCLCKVTFDANGGTLTDSAEVPVYETEKIIGTKANDLKAINDPTRPGYKFTGWYTTADGKPEDGKFDVDKTEITKDITLYAGWEFDPNAPVCRPLTVTGGTVTVKYDGSDVTSELHSTDAATGQKTYYVPEGAKVTVKLDKTAVPNGKVFDGWSTSNLSLLTGQDYKAESITFSMSNDVNVSAKYRDAATDHTHDTAVCHPLTVTGGIVTVKKGDKDVTDTLTVTTDETTGKKTYSVPEGAEVTVTLDKTAVPNGKVFDGWSTSLPTGQDYKAESITFTMNTMNSDVNVSATYRDAAADHTPDTAVCHPLTVTGGIVTVKKGDKDVTDTLTVTTDETTGKKTYSVPDGAEVTVTLDKTLIPEGMVFDIWSTGKFSLPLGQDYKAESITFPMSSDVVDIAAQYRDATIEDDGPNVLGTAAIIGTAAVGTAVLGYQAYSLGAEFAGKLMALPYFPSNRSALAMMLWEDAGKPMPESELLYPDVGQEERDMDLQHAARWAMENELIPDLNDEGTAPEEMKFYPDNAVSKIDVLKAWQKAQELKQNA